MKKNTRDSIVGLLVIIFIVWLGFTLVGNYKENKAEEKQAAFEKQISNIDFSNVDNASKDIDNILNSKVINYSNSDVTLNKGKYIVDVYVDLKSENYFNGSGELKDKLPIILDTLFKNKKINTICVWGNAKANFKGKIIQDNFLSVTFDRKTYDSIKDFKEFARIKNGEYIIEEKATSYTLDKRYELDYN